jgi:ABC-type sugar transport system permease subunit
MKTKRRISYERKLQIAGCIFLFPWLLGLVYFFVIPFIQTILYSLSTVSINDSDTGAGLNLVFEGFKNYRYILLEEPTFNRIVINSVIELFYSVPVIVAFSMFFAILLNKPFIGRTFMRSIFFLPVIIAGGPVIDIIRGDLFAQQNMNVTTAIFQTEAIEQVMANLGLSSKIIDTVTGVTSSIFDLTWESGIQLLLFLSALQGIPDSFYEAASIEGADAWESFWKITFPVLSPTSLLVVIYTIIDSFTKSQVMKRILDNFNDLKFGIASASAIVYFAVIMVVLALVFVTLGRRVNYRG